MLPYIRIVGFMTALCGMGRVGWHRTPLKGRRGVGLTYGKCWEVCRPETQCLRAPPLSVELLDLARLVCVPDRGLAFCKDPRAKVKSPSCVRCQSLWVLEEKEEPERIRSEQAPATLAAAVTALLCVEECCKLFIRLWTRRTRNSVSR